VTKRLAHAGYGVSLLIPLGLIAFLGWSARTRAFDPDEFQHLQMAWLIAIGELPYRDFFEHHTPLYHLAIAPFLGDPKLMTDGTAAIRALIGLRILSIALCMIILVQTEWIARAVSDRLATRGAALILAASGIFALKGLEIRPDQLAACLMLGATLLLVSADRAPRPIWLLAASGAAAMLAILTTQKLVFAVPGLAFTFAVIAVRRQMTAAPIVRAALAVVGGATLAALPLLTWFAANDALGVFFTDNFLLGASWPRDSRQLILILSAMLRDETLLVLLPVLGVIALSARGWRAALWPLAVVAPMISMVVLMPLFPVVQPQYLFLWLPYAAILGGIGAGFATECIGNTPVLRAMTTSLILGAITLHGVLVIKTQSTAYETEAFDKLRYTVEQTPPDAKVLRAWSPGMAFRRPAFFYFSLNPEIRAVVPQRDWVMLEAGLRNGQIAPELVEMDDAMRAMPSGIVRALEDHWAPTGTGNIWRRKAR
jgi:hypothetical protein